MKFVRRDVKRQVVSTSKSQGKKSPLHAYESLTPLRRKMVNTLRRMKSKVPAIVKGFSTMDGKVYAYTPPAAGNSRDRRHHIEDWDGLVLFCREFVKDTLDRFLNDE